MKMARPRGITRSSRRTVGARMSATTAATMRMRRTEPAARASAQSAEEGEREHHDLDPARDDDGRGPGGPSRGFLGVCSGLRHVSPVAASSTGGPPAWTASAIRLTLGLGGSAVRSRAHRRILVIMRVSGSTPE